MPLSGVNELDHSNRLLRQFARHGAETVCLALEVIENHAYEKSRFLRGAPVDEAKIEHEPTTDPARSAVELEVMPLGLAGSGKTAVTLAKLREAPGRVLYVTQAAYRFSS